jgi:hypothetical protein
VVGRIVGDVAAPEYVPQPAIQYVRSYTSPPRRPASWRADRPGDLSGLQPRGERLGSPGPDQGYIYLLARRFQGRLRLAQGEQEDDAIAGCVAVGLKRASLFGRAPVLTDLTVAFTIWGFLGDAPDELVELRRPLFAEVANPHHYPELRRVADLVSADALRQTPQQVGEAHRTDWRSLLDR